MAIFQSDVVITNGEVLHLESGETLSNISVDRGGTLYVFEGGSAGTTTVNSGGRIAVSSGGTATNIVAANGAKIDFVVIPETYVQGTYEGSAFEMKDSLLSGYTVNSGSFLRIYSSGTVKSTTVNIGGNIDVRGGTAISTTVNSGGRMRVFSGGTADNTTVNDGSCFVYIGGTANNTMVNGSAIFSVSSGGTATIVFNPWQGQISSDTGAEITFLERDANVYYGDSRTGVISKANVIDSMSLSIAYGQNAIIYSGGTANSTTVDSGGWLHVSTGGTANSTTVNSGGSLTVSSGGTANSTMINLSGYLLVGGTADSATVNARGIMHVYGTVNNTTVNASGSLLVASGGTADSTTVNDYGSMTVIGGGIAYNTTVKSHQDRIGPLGGMSVFQGGSAEKTIVSSGVLYVGPGGKANSTTVDISGRMFVSKNGIATEIKENGGYVQIEDGARVTFASNTINGLVLSGFEATIHSGTTAKNTTVLNGTLDVWGGITNNTTVDSHGVVEVCGGGVANNTTVNSGRLYLYGDTANSTTVNSGGKLFVYSGGTANSTTVNSDGSLYVFSGMATGRMIFETGAVVSMDEGAILNFDLTHAEAGAAALVNDLSIIQGTPTYTLTVDTSFNFVPGSYVYSLADGAADFTGTLSLVNKAGNEFSKFSVGETMKIGYNDYTLNLADGTLSVTIEAPDLTPTAPAGTPEKISWESTTEEEQQFIVEYSTDNFEHVITVVTTGNAVDTPDLPEGTYQWRVKADSNSDWVVGDEIVSEADFSVPKVVQAVEDDSDDLFFATPYGTWSRFYYANHVGSVNDWAGTNDLISAGGRGRIQNLFFGSDDPNVLCLTDGENGDAIFVDDIYTGLPDEVQTNTARLYKIREIRAGAGDDIVDMTSQQFEYTGDGLIIRGGDGGDVIWANKGDNLLFGDNGNDRIVGASGSDVIAGGIGNDSMHGGGGDDTFTFCDNWGTDTVKQLETGSVTLWFASGVESNWDDETMTYTDGKNSVTVSGVTAGQVMLKFGAGNTPEDATRFAAFSGVGAFVAYTSQKVFEETVPGALASL